MCELNCISVQPAFYSGFMASPGWGRHKIREKKFGGDTKLGRRTLDVLLKVQVFRLKYYVMQCNQSNSNNKQNYSFNNILCPTMSSNSETHVIHMGTFFFNIFDYKESNNALAIMDLFHLKMNFNFNLSYC